MKKYAVVITPYRKTGHNFRRGILVRLVEDSNWINVFPINHKFYFTQVLSRWDIKVLSKKELKQSKWYTLLLLEKL